MSTAVAKRDEDAGAIMESVIVKGDLGKLTPTERSNYYMQVCKSVGLNPLTRPFEYITLNNKLTLYARRDAADQLRKINNISIEIVSKSIEDGLLTVHVRAKDGAGRADEDFGVVSIGTLKGEAAANAFLKAVTKAKRRVTLSISGLGFLDETEVDDIPDARPATKPAPLTLAKPAPVTVPEHDEATGEIGPREIPVAKTADGAPDWITFGQFYIGIIGKSATLAEADAWAEKNDASLTAMKREAPKVYARMVNAVAKARSELVTDAEMGNGEATFADLVDDKG